MKTAITQLEEARRDRPDSVLIAYRFGEKFRIKWHSDQGLDELVVLHNHIRRAIDEAYNKTSNGGPLKEQLNAD